jgi:hypothetical protein
LDLEEALEQFTPSETETSDDLDTAASRGVPDEQYWDLRICIRCSGFVWLLRNSQQRLDVEKAIKIKTLGTG